MSNQPFDDESAKLLDSQNQKLGTLYEAIKNVKGHALGINEEVTAQKPIIGKLTNKVEYADDKLKDKNKQLDVIVNTEKNWCGMWPYYGVVIVQIFIILIIVASWF
jgi:hypothetical protein